MNAPFRHAPSFRWNCAVVDKAGDLQMEAVWAASRAQAELAARRDCEERGVKFDGLEPHWDAILWPDGTIELRCGAAGDAVATFARQLTGQLRSAGFCNGFASISLNDDSSGSTVVFHGVPSLFGAPFEKQVFRAARLEAALLAAETEIRRVTKAQQPAAPAMAAE